MPNEGTKKQLSRGPSRASSSPTSARLLKGRPLDPVTDDVEVRPPEAIAHPDLLAKPEDAVKPVAVQNGRMHGLYMSAGFERDKNKRKLVHLDFSIVLEEACAGLVPEKVR